MLHSSRGLLRVWLPALLVAAPTAAAQSKVTFSVPFGPHAVGFRDVRLHDSSRTVQMFDGRGELIVPGRPRPMQLSIWYPARPTAGAKPMLYREYTGVFAAPRHFGSDTSFSPAQAEKAFLDFLASLNLTTREPNWRARRTTEVAAAAGREFDVPTHAYRDAPRAPGRYPVVIYSPGMGGHSFENDILVEYLASHGYLVVASPSRGETGPFSNPERTGFTSPADAAHARETHRANLEAVTRDIEFLIGYARALPEAGPGGVAVMGHSFGGFANVAAASRGNTVAAIVSLDGSIRYFFDEAVAEQFSIAPSYTTPSLFLNQGANTDHSMFARAGADTGFAFFDSLRYANAYRVTMRTIDHQNFVALFNRFSGPQRVNFVSDAAISNLAYDRIAQFTLNFLNAYLKGDPAGVAFLNADPRTRGVGADLTIERKTGLRPLPTLASFAEAARVRGLANALQLLEEVRRSNPAFTIPETQLSDWGWDLYGPDRVGVFSVRTALYPGSPGAHNDLGDAYLARADTASAIRSFERSLQLDSTRAYAREALQRIRR